MDPNRFDHLSKSFARRVSRRGILAGLGMGSVAAGVGVAPSLAADGDVTCVYAFDATIDVGPSSTVAQTNAAAGQLTFTVSANGAIDSGALMFPNGKVWAAVGQATGRAISLRFSVPNTGAFIAVGVGRHDIATCPSAMAGPASGPLRQDAGSWSATLTSGTAAGSAPTAVAPPASGNGQSTTAPVEQPTQAPAEPPTAEPTEALTTDCQLQCDGTTLGLDPAGTCVCVCANGLSNCVDGSCADVSSDVNNCGRCGVVCPGIPNEADPTCVSGICGFACLGGLVTCSLDAVCKTFLDRDNGHCGSCGNACGGATPTCVNSVCSCALHCSAIETPNADCTACVKCSLDIFKDPQNCGSCGNVCGGATPTCVNGGCVCTADTTSDQNNCGACGNVCPTFSPVCQAGQCVAPPKA